MNIYDYLKKDHREVSNLFAQFKKEKNTPRKKEIVDTLCQELFVHSHAEQETFYRAMKHHPLTKDDAIHSIDEHQEIEDQLEQVLSSTDFGAAWEKRVLKLQDLVEHHVKEEENFIFSEAKQIFSPEEAVALKEKVHNHKQKLLKTIQKRLANHPAHGIWKAG